MTIHQLRQILIWLSPVFFMAMLTWIVFDTERHWNAARTDSIYFWLAGEFWTAGLSPYDEAYSAQISELTGITWAGAWYYTPNWYFISALLAKFDMLTASRIWFCLGIALLMAGSILNAASFKSINSKSAIAASHAPLNQFAATMPAIVLFFLHASYMGLSQATDKTFELGQSSILIYFGVSLLIWSVLRERFYAGAIGLAIVMLKPQLGMLIVAALLFSRLGRRITFVAAIISILASLPAFLISPPHEIASDLLNNISGYGDIVFNMAASSTGLRNIVWTLGGDAGGMPPYQLLALTILLLCGGALYLRNGAPPQTIDLVMLAATVAHVFAPYHYYDFVVLGALAYYCASLRTAAAVISIIAFGLMFRAGNLPNMPSLQGDGVMAYGGNVYMTIAAAMLLFALIRELWIQSAPVTAVPGSLKPSGFSNPENYQHTEF